MMVGDLHLVVGLGCTRHQTRDETTIGGMVYFYGTYLVRTLFPYPRGLFELALFT
jgi:hypothetical protein